MPRHTRQLGKFDCGLAVAATLAGVPLAAAAEARPDPAVGRTKGMTAGHMEELLCRLWRLPWRTWARQDRGRGLALAGLAAAAAGAVLIRDPDDPAAPA